ncbi:MAG: 30S ribosome-binding factor RbfA [Candidatus Acididesulfobacter guangdongensis]|uniref:Ribosome-binding factor A n=1 Tax=Acididesulfobacter guangdongensis TaxID=2597225 RepID=A0A519BED5_ACIG2|nr:MAG: 30S ribosome-binding factor RbfA [Candidatus Acididesulfobacter guangdongensis]
MIERNKRVAELIAREVSLVLEFKINDDRLKNVTILRAEISKDLRYCKIFFSVIAIKNGNIYDMQDSTYSDYIEKEVKKVMSGFKSSKHFIKKEVFSKVLLRLIPDLSFEYDPGIEQSSRILKIINDNKKITDDNL